MSTGTRKRKKPTPQCLAMILCDRVITEQGTGKHVLVGTFSRIHAASLPCVHPAMSVFIALTEGRGAYAGRVRLVHAETDRAIFEGAGDLDFENPLDVVEIVMVLPPIRFQEPGPYHLELYVDEQLLMSRKFDVRGAGGRTMNPPPVQQSRTLGCGKVVTWEIVVHGDMRSLPSAASALSDAELARGAAESGAFAFLKHPDEDLYTLEDGREV